MSLVDLVAVLMFIGVIAYALFGGADFGTGVWDLTAGGDRRGGPLRVQIDRSLGPVWEANHVWLIDILVFLWTAFPSGFAAMMRTLFVPFMLAGLGIVLRGAAFAFRKFSAIMRAARWHGLVFATSSVLTPFVFGMIVGAVTSGRVPAEGTGDLWRSWTGPTSWIGGVLAVLTCAFLAATFLAADAERAGEDELARSIGAKALWAGVLSGAASIAAAVTLELDAETLASRLHTRGLPLIVVSAVSGATALWLLARQRWAWARVAAVGAVGAVVVGWGVAQYPDLLVDHSAWPMPPVPVDADRAAGRVRSRRRDRRAEPRLALRARQPAVVVASPLLRVTSPAPAATPYDRDHGPGGGTGRRRGLKPPSPQGGAGSIPAPGTVI